MNNALQNIKITAPGKLVLIGEYSVVEGGSAVVVAVNRRVVAFEGEAIANGLIKTAFYKTLEGLGEAPSEARIMVDSSALYEGAAKLGLGSSAAVATAAAAYAFAKSGFEPSEFRKDIMLIAREAQREFQKSRSSGVDCAASAFGGTTLYTNGIEPLAEPLRLPDSLKLVFAWTGLPSETSPLLAKVGEFARNKPFQYKALIETMNETTLMFAGACARNAALEAVAAAEFFADSMRLLGGASGANIVCKKTEDVILLARSLGGAAKPSGAGGGDFTLGFFADEEAAKEFAKRVKEMNFKVMNFEIDPEGVRVEAK